MVNRENPMGNLSPYTRIGNVSPEQENRQTEAEMQNEKPKVEAEQEKAKPKQDNVSPQSKVSPAFKCPDVDFMPKNPRYANAYVPYQQWNKKFSAEESLDKGTVFPELFRPYTGKTKPYMCGEMDGDDNG